MIQRILPGDKELLDHLCFVWENAKADHTYEGRIVALADYLSVISHLWQEVQSANASLYGHYDSVMEYLHTFDDAIFDFVRPIVEETNLITQKIFARRQELDA